MSINLIKDWFYYTRVQRRGIIVLLVLLVAIPIIGEIIKSRISLQQIDQQAFLAEVRLFEEQLAQYEAEADSARSYSRSATTARGEPSGRQVVFEPFAFDPNRMSQAEWDSLGMPGHISRSIQNFLAAGGGFRYKEDFKRIYLLDDWMYNELESYITLPVRPVANSPPARARQTEYIAGTDHQDADHNTSKELNRSASGGDYAGESCNRAGITDVARFDNENIDNSASAGAGKTSGIDHSTGYRRTDLTALRVNINTADTTELQKMRGIGPAFSRRIVGYRELLGGFTHPEQLLEVFGLDSARFEEIRDFVITDSIVRNKVKLNTADFGDLVRHPYIDRQTAGAILNLRRQHGPFQGVDDLKKSYLIDDVVVQRLLPYVCVEAVEKDISKILSD